MKKKPTNVTVLPEQVAKGMMFEHLGLMWEVTCVRPDEASKAFYSRIWMSPAGYADCRMKLDVMLSDQMKWIRLEPIFKRDK